MTCSGSSGSPAPAGGHMVASLYLAQWCQSTRQRWPRHALRRSSWAQCVCPGSAQAHASPGRGLFGPIDHADLTCTLRPTAVFFVSSYLFSLGNLGKEVLFLLQEWRQLFFFFFKKHLSSFGMNPQTLVFFLQGEEGGVGWTFIPAGSCQTGLQAGQPQCSLAVSLLHTLPRTVRTSPSWVPALPVPPFLC